jgi:DHA2 family multidrug resistance protein
VTTLLERRSQYHQSVLITHVTNADPTVQLTLSRIADRLTSAGYTSADALVRAPAQLQAIVHSQATFLGGLDCFWLLGLLAMIGPLLALRIRAFDQSGAGRKTT